MVTKPLAPIAYISHSFPLLTETFVYREVFGLQRRGLTVYNFAIWRPDPARLSPEVAHLIDNVHYVFPLNWLKFIKAHFYFLLSHPWRYLSILFFVISRPGESWANRRRTLIHFLDAVYLAWDMKRLGIKHIHAQFAINAATIALVCARLLKITFSFTAHNSFFMDRVILPQKIKEARFVAAISEFSRQLLLRLAMPPSPAEKIHIIHCGLNPDDFTPVADEPANDVPLLLLVAQLAERKGAPVLVEACRILQQRGLAFQCVIAGDGPQMPLLKQRVTEYGLQNMVELPGMVFQKQVKAYLKQADVFVLPCITAANGDIDGVPVSLMEAMAMEIPVVSTTVSGIPELIEDGVSGLLVAEQDSAALADALERLITQVDLRTTLGKAGRQKIIAGFNIEKSTTQLANLFTQYLHSL